MMYPKKDERGRHPTVLMDLLCRFNKMEKFYKNKHDYKMTRKCYENQYKCLQRLAYHGIMPKTEELM